MASTWDSTLSSVSGFLCLHRNRLLHPLAFSQMQGFIPGASVCLPLQRTDRVKYLECEQECCLLKMANQSKSSPLTSPAREQVPDPIPKLTINVVVEFESVLAFHESELHRLLENNGIVATVRKDLLPREHAALLGGRKRDSHRRSHFSCWELYVAADELAIDNLPLCTYGTLRLYFIEPLLIALNTLKTCQCPTSVMGYTAPGPPIIYSGPRDKTALLPHCDVDYDHWKLMYDWSVPSATRSELRWHLSYQIDKLSRPEWDSWAVELVPRKFDYVQKRDAFEESAATFER